MGGKIPPHSEKNMHESSVGPSSTTKQIPNLEGNHPTACSGKPMSTQQKAEPLGCLSSRTRGGIHVHDIVQCMHIVTNMHNIHCTKKMHAVSI